MPPVIAVIHATRAAVAPVDETFKRLWPEAETFSLLDESLSRDLEKLGEVTPAIADRIARLARFVKDGGAEAILYSCSAFGDAIESARASMDIPVLKPNEAMLEEALAAGSHIRIVATYMPTIPSITSELQAMSAARDQKIVIDPCLVPGALEALAAGDGEKHDSLIADAVSNRLPCDVVLLGQFSMARAMPLVKEKIDTIVLSSPDSAVLSLRVQMSLIREPV